MGFVTKKKGNIVWGNQQKTVVKFEEDNICGKWTMIKYWKPNLIQRFLYWLGIMKDPRYNGKKTDRYKLDEYVIGIDPYKTN